MLLKKIHFVVNPHDNGGEQIIITTEFHDNGDRKDNIYMQQEITMQSYCNSASISLFGAILSPERLRKMADEIEATMKTLKK